MLASIIILSHSILKSILLREEKRKTGQVREEEESAKGNKGQLSEERVKNGVCMEKGEE